MPLYRRLPLCMATAAGFLAACSHTTAPQQAQLPDPQALSSDLRAASGVFTSSTFQGFSILSDTTTGSPVAAPTRAGTLLRAAPILQPRSLAAPYVDVRPQFQALRRLATTWRSGIGARVVPPTLLGQTFTWDVNTHAYVEDAAYTPAAPSDRMRIILYALAASTNFINEFPLTPVGYADFKDESTTSPAVDKVRIIITGGTPASPGTEYVNYVVSAQVTGNPVTTFTASASGSVSDDVRTLTIGATYAVTQVNTDNPDVAADIVWSWSDPAIQLESHETLTLTDADHVILDLTKFSITRGTEAVSLHGTVNSVLSTGAFTVNLTADVNATSWARFSGSNGTVQLRHADGT